MVQRQEVPAESMRSSEAAVDLRAAADEAENAAVIWEVTAMSTGK